MERLLFECATRSTLIAALAAAVLSAMRIKNVAARHSTWTGVLLFMLALPLLVASGRSGSAEDSAATESECTARCAVFDRRGSRHPSKDRSGLNGITDD